MSRSNKESKIILLKKCRKDCIFTYISFNNVNIVIFFVIIIQEITTIKWYNKPKEIVHRPPLR